jgi:hypothetical protein
MQTASNPVLASDVRNQVLKAESTKIHWDPSLPVFAKEEFLRAVGDEYGWLGGIDDTQSLRCILPYTIVRKGGLRLVRFRVATIPYGAPLNVLEEKSFLNSVILYFRNIRADAIIPPANNALFRTYPDGARTAPYGSYVIDLQQPEKVLWQKIANATQRNIKAALRDHVSIREGMEFLDPAYDLIRETFSRSKMDFMDRGSFKRFAFSLGEHGKLLMAEHQGMAQSYSLFAFSTPCAYWIYGGNVQNLHQGAMKRLHWEAIRLFRNLGVCQYDFFGARINPPKGSKQENINQMKKHLGASLVQGFTWKYSLRPWRASVYSFGVRLLRHGDLVDQEEHKMKDYVATIGS